MTTYICIKLCTFQRPCRAITWWIPTVLPGWVARTVMTSPSQIQQRSQTAHLSDS